MLWPDHIRAAKAALKLKTQDLADLAGIPKETLGRIERGDVSPRANTLAKIEDALKEMGIDYGTSAQGARYIAWMPPEDN